MFFKIKVSDGQVELGWLVMFSVIKWVVEQQELPVEDNYFISPGTRLSPGPASQPSQKSRNETIPPGGCSLFSMAVYSSKNQIDLHTVTGAKWGEVF